LQWLAAPFPSHRPVAAAKLDAICGAASLTPPGLESLDPPPISRPFRFASRRNLKPEKQMISLRKAK